MHSYESIHKLSDEREWGSVLDSERVQSAIVLDGSEISILLLDKEEGEHVGGFRLADTVAQKTVPMFGYFAKIDVV